MSTSPKITQQELAEAISAIPAMVRVYQAGERQYAATLARIRTGISNAEERKAAEDTRKRLDGLRAGLTVIRNRLWAMCNQAMNAGLLTATQMENARAAGLFDTSFELEPNENMQAAAQALAETGLQGLGALRGVIATAIAAAIVALGLAAVLSVFMSQIRQMMPVARDVAASVRQQEYVYDVFDAENKRRAERGEPPLPAPVRADGRAPGSMTQGQIEDHGKQNGGSVLPFVGGAVLAVGAMFAAWWKWGRS